jgi:hypothetical protein
VTAFWCDLHKERDATPIAGITIVRRVCVVAQIVLSSAVGTDQIARAEAVARLVAGIESAGGLFNLHVVTSQTGPWAVPPGLGEENQSREAP